MSFNLGLTLNRISLLSGGFSSFGLIKSAVEIYVVNSSLPEQGSVYGHIEFGISQMIAFADLTWCIYYLYSSIHSTEKSTRSR
jgi:hypothetical protein